MKRVNTRLIDRRQVADSPPMDPKVQARMDRSWADAKRRSVALRRVVTQKPAEGGERAEKTPAKVAPKPESTAQIEDGMSMLDAWSHADAKLLELGWGPDKVFGIYPKHCC